MGRYDALLTASLRELKLEELKAIPDDSEINHTFSQNFQIKMESIFSSLGEKALPAKASAHTVLKKAAVFILCFLMTATGIIMFDDEARADFYNAVTFIYEEYIKFGFRKGELSSADFTDIENVELTYIPEGFALKETSGLYEAKEYAYSDTESTFYVNVALNDGLSVITDKDKENIEKISVSGRDSYLICGENNGKPYSTLIITGNKITVTVYGQINREEIIRVGEGLKEKRKTP